MRILSLDVGQFSVHGRYCSRREGAAEAVCGVAKSKLFIHFETGACLWIVIPPGSEILLSDPRRHDDSWAMNLQS